MGDAAGRVGFYFFLTCFYSISNFLIFLCFFLDSIYMRDEARRVGFWGVRLGACVSWILMCVRVFVLSLSLAYVYACSCVSCVLLCQVNLMNPVQAENRPITANA